MEWLTHFKAPSAWPSDTSRCEQVHRCRRWKSCTLLRLESAHTSSQERNPRRRSERVSGFLDWLPENHSLSEGCLSRRREAAAFSKVLSPTRSSQARKEIDPSQRYTLHPCKWMLKQQRYMNHLLSY